MDWTGVDRAQTLNGPTCQLARQPNNKENVQYRQFKIISQMCIFFVANYWSQMTLWEQVNLNEKGKTSPNFAMQKKPKQAKSHKIERGSSKQNAKFH